MDAPVGRLIRAVQSGDGSAARELFAALYGELHRIAERQLHGGAGDMTLGTTTLLHETYLNISAREGLHFADRGHFLAYAARAMRGLTIDYARRRRVHRRGGGFQLTASYEGVPTSEEPADVDRLEELSAALDRLAEVDAPLAQLVDLHFFAGFTLIEIADMRGVSERTAQRDWRKARLLLFHAMHGKEPRSDDELR